MLLAELKTQSEKENFINLAYLVAKADGSLGYYEQELIKLFLAEMDMTMEQVSSQPIAVNGLNSIYAEPAAREIVFANLLSLAFADGYDNEAKQCVIDVIQQGLGITAAAARKCETEMKIVAGSYVPQYCD